MYGADTLVATGDYFVSLTGTTNAAIDSELVADMLAIGRTLTADNVGDIDASTLEHELGELRAAPLPPCR